MTASGSVRTDATAAFTEGADGLVAAGTVTTTATAAFTEAADGIVAAGDIVTEAAVQTAAVRHAYDIDNRTTAVVSNARTYEFGD